MKNLILIFLLAQLLILPMGLVIASSVPQSAVMQDEASSETTSQPTVEKKGSKIFGFLKDINALNIVLIAFGTFASGLWFKGRTKLKQLADIFQKAYEYTDDKKLSDDERTDLINRFFEIIGKKPS